MRLKQLIFFLLLMLFVSGLLYYFKAQNITNNQATGTEKQQTGQQLTPLADKPQAPGFNLPDENGQLFTLDSFKGKPLIINFWATWCPPCRAELPSMNRAWMKIKDDGIGMLAVNIGEDEDTIFAFTAEQPIDFKILLDKEGQITSSWPVQGLPTTYVVDKDGRLVYVAMGEREWDSDQMLDKVRELK